MTRTLNRLLIALGLICIAGSYYMLGIHLDEPVGPNNLADAVDRIELVIRGSAVLIL